MALFFPGISTCSITGRILNQNDEIAYFGPFLHADPLIQKCSDGVIDFAAVRNRPEFDSLINLYRSLSDRKHYIFKNNDGALIRCRYGQIELVFFPLLLILSVPETTVQNLCASNFSKISLLTGQGRFEDYGFELSYAHEQLTAQSCPTKYIPSVADPKLVQKLIRRGRSVIEPFLKFIEDVTCR